MILVDTQGDKPDKHPGLDLINHISRIGVYCEREVLEFGDAAFEGNGPEGTILVGIERKALHDMLNCIDDARYSGHQRIGMKQMYKVSILMVEGHWKPHDSLGLLMEGFAGGTSWAYCKNRTQRIMYAKLFRYLVSVQLSGVIVILSRDLFHTAYNICELFHYFQKPWHAHTSLLEIHKTQLTLPTLNHKPSLVRKWAHDIESVGLKLSERAERHFRKPIALAMADESEWLRIPGIGVKTAQEIVREIHGLSR